MTIRACFNVCAPILIHTGIGIDITISIIVDISIGILVKTIRPTTFNISMAIVISVMSVYQKKIVANPYFIAVN